jgi:CDP-diacylglycerol--serine O-phosphatidyltransferase
MKGKRRTSLTFRQILPNMITSGNILCGMLALVLVLHGKPGFAAWLVFMAVFFDFMDGKVARSIGGSSAFGVELDSLADVVSFGVAPALIFYSSYLRDWLGVTGALVAAFFALCGALRLARFNVQHAEGSAFQGFPIPAAGLFLASLVMAGWSLPPVAAALIALFMGLLMVSNVPYGNLKGLRKGNANRHKVFFLVGLILTFIAFLKSAAPLASISIYLVSGFLHFDWGAWLSRDGEDVAEQDL